MTGLLLRAKRWMLLRLAVRTRRVHVGRDVHVGPGTVLWAPRQLTIANNVYIGKNVTIEADGSIGEGTMVANMVGVVGRLDHDFRRVGVRVRDAPWVGDEPDRLSSPFVIGSDVWVGYGAVILSGVTVSDGAIVAAGAVVTKDVPPYTVVAGAPARRVADRFSPLDLQEHLEMLQTQSPTSRAARIDRPERLSPGRDAS